MQQYSADIFAGLSGASFTQPDSVINSGEGPLPSIPSWAPPQIKGYPDGRINTGSSLLGDLSPYSYGPNAARISTQTQNAIPNKVQLIIPPIFIPSAENVGGAARDPILEHATNDGDLVFSLKMNYKMQSQGNQYCEMPYSTAVRALKLVNLATVNYLLWGLQVGTNLPNGRGNRWDQYFLHMCQTAHTDYLGGKFTMESIWNFLRTYISPYGIQHGSDLQGGMHEGASHRVATSPNSYVSAFAIEGKLLKVNNLWRASEIEENDDLVLELCYMPPQTAPISFNLCSSSRANRTESAPVPMGWWYLQPTVLKYKTIIETPHIHIGRSQKLIGAYPTNKWGMGMPPWNARACILGTPIQMTFEPHFVMSDMMSLRMLQEWVQPGVEEGHSTQNTMEAPPPAADGMDAQPPPPPVAPLAGGRPQRIDLTMLGPARPAAARAGVHVGADVDGGDDASAADHRDYVNATDLFLQSIHAPQQPKKKKTKTSQTPPE